MGRYAQRGHHKAYFGPLYHDRRLAPAAHPIGVTAGIFTGENRDLTQRIERMDYDLGLAPRGGDAARCPSYGTFDIIPLLDPTTGVRLREDDIRNSPFYSIS